MPDFTITTKLMPQPIPAWHVLDHLGDIQGWSNGIGASKLMSDGPVGFGTTGWTSGSEGTVEIDRGDRQDARYSLNLGAQRAAVDERTG